MLFHVVHMNVVGVHVNFRGENGGGNVGGRRAGAGRDVDEMQFMPLLGCKVHHPADTFLRMVVDGLVGVQ